MRITTKIGDIFEVKVDDNMKKYFQYISNDLIQLNSSVIRAFKKNYSIHENPNSEDIVNDEVSFYSHAILTAGIKSGFWSKVGKSTNVGETKNVLFRDCRDYGKKLGEEPVKISHQWYVWKINDENFTYVGDLKGENRNAFIGLVINPKGIIELLKGNKYPPLYPDFD